VSAFIFLQYVRENKWIPIEFTRIFRDQSSRAAN